MRRLLHSKHRSGCFSACLIIFLSAAEIACAGVIDSISGEVQQVFEKAAPAIVKVRSTGGYRPLAGTGFFIDSEGTLLTSYEVVRDSPDVWIEYKAQKLQAKILGRDQRSGVALLKVDEHNTPYLPFGNSDAVKMASGVIGIAYPYNLPLTPSFGWVKGFDVRYLNRFFATTHIRASVDVSPGEIGGPLLNDKGEVVAMLVLAIQDGKECYGLPIKAAGRIVGDIKTYGYAKHGWVGVGVVEGQSSGAEPAQAVLVDSLYDNTPASTSGIKKGDQVLSIGKHTVSDPRDILDAAFYSRIGESVPVKVLRNGKERLFAIKVVERPSSSNMVDRKILEESADGLTLPFVTEPGKQALPNQMQPVRVNAHN